MKRRSLTRLLAGVVGLLVLLVGWVVLAPTQIGGSTSYAVIVGNSMEPMLHRGDLAIVRSHRRYGAGDVVLYESPALGAKVLHRILRVEDGRYVFKGDNNSFIDGERPTEEQLVGELWVNVPGVGRITEWVRRPAHAALIAGLATLLALGGGAGLGFSERRRRRPRRSRPVAAGEPQAPVDLQPVLAAIGTGLVLFSVLAFAAFTRPETRLDPVEEAYVQQGKIDYAAEVPQSPVYPDGLVSTGEPIFLKLVSRLRVTFDYRLESRVPVTAKGRIALDARLTDGRGWERVLPLSPDRGFTGPHATASGTLDLRRVQGLIDQLRELTGSNQAAYSLTLLPRVSVDGTAGRDAVAETFAPSAVFDLGDLRLQPSVEASGDGVSPFAPRRAGTGTRLVADELTAGSLALPVRTARRLSLIGLAASLLLGALALGSLLQRRHGDERHRIAATYGHLLLPVSARPPGRPAPTDLADIESLVRLAEQRERMILHVAERGGDSYLVEDGANAYRYRASGLPAVEDTPPPPAPGPDRAYEIEETLEGALIPGGEGRRYGTRRRSFLGSFGDSTP